jgi:cytochrome c-type biogenesis protein
MTDVSFPLAFLAGVASFLSPCVLPLFPSYVSFITGISFKDLTVGTDRKKIHYLTITNSLAFIAGFSSVFIALGISSSAIGRFFDAYVDFIRILGGVLIILFGLFVSGLVKLDFLMIDKKIYLSGKPGGYIGTFLVGMTFAAGWSPCIGPILGTILLYTGAKGSALFGFQLLAIYSLGLAIPFFLSALGLNLFLSYTPRIIKHMRVIMMVSGLILILFGVMLLFDKVRELTRFIPDFGIKI